MNKKTLLPLSCLMAALTFTACSDDDDNGFTDLGSKVEIPSGERVYVLNQGTWGMNNTSLTLFSPSTDATIENLFKTQNGVMLGDNAQDMIASDGNIYIAVNGSNYITRLNAAGVEQARMSFASTPDLQGGVRYIAADGGYIYATFYGGYIARLDAKTLEIDRTLHTSAGNLEGLIVKDGKIYAANSWATVTDPATQQTSYQYYTNLVVVDVKTFTEEKKGVTVAPNPNLIAQADGKVFVISWGNYADRGNEFQTVNLADGTSTTITEAKDMAVGNGKVYLLKTQTDWATMTTQNEWLSYDIASSRLSTESFLKDAPDELASEIIYMMDVDPTNGDIYIGVTYYASGNGDIYRFDRNGRFISTFDAGGQNPLKAVFLK